MAKGIQFQPQASNPLTVGERGVWVDSADNLIVERISQPAQNVTQDIIALQAGFGISALSATFANNSGVTINKFTPVYSPAAGTVGIADGTDDLMSRVIGITTADIAHGSSGSVIYIGKVDITPTALTHGKFIYLGLTPGSMVDVSPSLLGGYPVGFDVILIGVLSGTELILRFQHVGTL